MSTTVIAILAILAWIFAGFWRFLALMGHKYHKDTWLDKVLMTPLIPIAYLVGAIGWLIHDRD